VVEQHWGHRVFEQLVSPFASTRADRNLDVFSPSSLCDWLGTDVDPLSGECFRRATMNKGLERLGRGDLRAIVPGLALLGLASLAVIGCGTQAQAPQLQAPQAQAPVTGWPSAPASTNLPAAQPESFQQAQNTSPAGPVPAGPVMVNCGPGQQTLIRPTIVNGQAVSQVDCVATAPLPATPLASWPPAYSRDAYVRPASLGDLETVRIVERPVERPVERVVYRDRARPVSYRTAEYEPERVRSGRSWKKSAVIIGSSAGVGAGVGAAVGGKKGALIGAAIGGGSAAIWDQATRR
jgi:hypothetical protein